MFRTLKSRVSLRSPWRKSLKSRNSRSLSCLRPWRSCSMARWRALLSPPASTLHWRKCTRRHDATTASAASSCSRGGAHAKNACALHPPAVFLMRPSHYQISTADLWRRPLFFPTGRLSSNVSAGNAYETTRGDWMLFGKFFRRSVFASRCLKLASTNYR